MNGLRLWNYCFNFRELIQRIKKNWPTREQVGNDYHTARCCLRQDLQRQPLKESSRSVVCVREDHQVVRDGLTKIFEA